MEFVLGVSVEQLYVGGAVLYVKRWEQNLLERYKFTHSPDVQAYLKKRIQIISKYKRDMYQYIRGYHNNPTLLPLNVCTYCNNWCIDWNYEDERLIHNLRLAMDETTYIPIPSCASCNSQPMPMDDDAAWAEWCDEDDNVLAVTIDDDEANERTFDIDDLAWSGWREHLVMLGWWFFCFWFSYQNLFF